jgi:4-amino-4-deoxy-L-arabinose transferase-like glycosyltransferase
MSWWKTWKPAPVVALVAMVVVLTALRVTVAGNALLSGDEAYYWLWSRRLQLSYFDHPGMSAWWIWLSTASLGDSELAVRLPSVLAAALVSLLVFDTARLAFADAWAGLWAALLINATILFGAAAVTATPDGPLLVFWSLALWAMVRLLRSDRPIWLYVLGTALGLGFISKYTMVLIAPGVIAVFLLFAQGRAWLNKRHFYQAIGLAVVCTLPVLGWNALHDWVSIRKQLAHSFDAPVASPLGSLATFAATQVGVMTPLILPICLTGMGWALWAGWRQRRPDWFMMGACSAPVLAFFVNHSLGGLVQPHWSGPAYLGAAMAAAGGWTLLGDQMSPRLRRLVLAAPILGGAMIGLSYLQMATAVLPIPARLDTLGRLGGWDRLAEAVETQRKAHPGAFLFVQKHEISGLMTYYSPDHPIAFLTGSAGIPRIPSYDAKDVAALAGRDGLFVVKAGGRGVEDAGRNFAAMSQVASVERAWGGRVIDSYEIWLGEGYRPGGFGEVGP